MAFTVFKNNFTSGEWSPYLDGRTDLDGYGSAAKRLENVRPMQYGGVVFRGGLERINDLGPAGDPLRLVPFTYSTFSRYVLEFGHNVIRVYKAGQLGAQAPIATVSTGYSGVHVFELQMRQINDVMYIVHDSYQPSRLRRLSDTSWDIAWVYYGAPFGYPPMLEENVDSNAKLRLHAKAGNNVTMTSSGFSFNSGHVGSFFELQHFVEGKLLELPLTLLPSGTYISNPVEVRGEWEFSTSEFWWGDIYLERQVEGNSGWEVVRRWSAKSDHNVSSSGIVDPEQGTVFMRLRYHCHGDPYMPPAMNDSTAPAGTYPENWRHAVARFEVREGFARALVRVVSYSSPSSVQVTIYYQFKGHSTEFTDRWAEGAWSQSRGWPRSIGFYEQRLIYGGTRSNPQRVWGSVMGDFDNFRYSDHDDSAVSFDIAATEGNPILWIEGLTRLIIGTSGGEFSLSGGDGGDSPLGPSSVLIRAHSNYGSLWSGPVLANDALLFFDRQGRRVRALSYSLESDGIKGPDLTVFSEHLFRERQSIGQVKHLAFARGPEPTIYACLGRDLGVMIYDKEAGVMAWSRYTTGSDGVFESVCSVYGDDVDEVWVVVRRRVGGVWRRFLERFMRESETKEAARYLDCNVNGVLSYPSWNGQVVVGSGGIWDGHELRLIVGGAYIGDFVVSGNAIIVPDKMRKALVNSWAAAEVVQPGSSLSLRRYCAGVAYRGVVETMRLEADLETGSSAGKRRRVHKIVPRFEYTGEGVKFGPSLERLEDVHLRVASDATDASAPLYSGDKELTFPMGYDSEGRVVITQDKSLPFKLLGVAITAEVSGN